MLEKVRFTLRNRVHKANLLQIGSAILSVVIVLLVTLNTKMITISDQSGMISVMSVGTDATQIIKKAGIDMDAADSLQTIVDKKGNIVRINITRAFGVPVFVDGAVKTVYANGQSVKQLLEKAQVVLNEGDHVIPSLDTVAFEGMQIDVKRISTEQYTTQETIQAQTSYVYTSVLKTGRQLVRSEGSDGVRLNTYENRYVNGVLSQTLLVKSEDTAAQADRIVAVGKKGAPVSTFHFADRPIGSNGVPTQYTKVINSARTTGYSVKPGQGTASGMAPVPGVVAVDPNKIPYGTRLYITSADGSFVYGYAIAGETGVALREGRVDLDLLYPTYDESCAHGVRYVNIYFLD